MLPNTNMQKTLNFGESGSHGVLGIVTLKDLFARLCQLELKDEDEHIYSIVGLINLTYRQPLAEDLVQGVQVDYNLGNSLRKILASYLLPNTSEKKSFLVA